MLFLRWAALWFLLIQGLVASLRGNPWGAHAQTLARADWDAPGNPKIQDLPWGAPFDRCEVHGVRLEPAVVPIVYGYLPAGDRDRDFLVAQADFPHAEDPVEGGCIYGATRVAHVGHCPKCVEAKRRWLLAHPDVDAQGVPR